MLHCERKGIKTKITVAMENVQVINKKGLSLLGTEERCYHNKNDLFRVDGSHSKKYEVTQGGYEILQRQ